MFVIQNYKFKKTKIYLFLLICHRALNLTLASLGSTEFFEPADRNNILIGIINESYKGTKVGLQFLIDNYDNIILK